MIVIHTFTALLVGKRVDNITNACYTIYVMTKRSFGTQLKKYLSQDYPKQDIKILVYGTPKWGVEGVQVRVYNTTATTEEVEQKIQEFTNMIFKTPFTIHTIVTKNTEVHFKENRRIGPWGKHRT